MAAPPVVSLENPVGTHFLDDGFSTTIVFAARPTMSFKEKDVKPGGFDGGEPIDNSTMRNTRYHTMAPRTLIKVDPITMNVTYDTRLISQAQALIIVRTSCTIHFPDASTLSMYCFMQKFEQQELKEGELPMASITVVPTNYDPTNRVEQGPVWGDGTGTGS